MTFTKALALLRTDFPGLLDDLARGERVFWIGSGLSRNQVPGLEPLLRKVLVYLRDRIDDGGVDDPHRHALEAILAEYLPSELTLFQRDEKLWSVPADLSDLVSSYSKILATEVGDEAPDYLLWAAVDVRETYGSPAIEPGAEHWLVAFMIHEGILEDAVTTNWDGLIERALAESTIPGRGKVLSLLMTNDSFRNERGRCRLHKAHGCAVLARCEPTAYRQYLVAQTYDIVTWQENPIYLAMVERLRFLAKNRKSLMLGSSMQDFNLLERIAGASQDLPWSWNPSDPAYLFAGPSISSSQLEVLKVVYRDDYPPNRAAIREGSATGMYSGPLLGAAFLHTVFEKFKIALGYALAFADAAPVVESLERGVARLEEHIAELAGDDGAQLVELVRSGVSSMMQRFYEPNQELMGNQYKPVYEGSVKVAIDDRFRHLNLPELSVALGLLGLGYERGYWTLAFVTGAASETGVIEITSTHLATNRVLKVVVTRDWNSASVVKTTDLWVFGTGDVLLLQASGESVPALSRGPGGGLGTGRTSGHRRRHVALSAIASFAGDPDGLMDAFRAEVSV